MIKRKVTLAVFAALLILGSVTSTAYAEISVYGGLERFNWREYDSSGRELLEESGYRLVTGFESVAEGESGILLDYEGRFYGSSVDYDGETQDSVPLDSKTSYAGLLAEYKPHLRLQPARFEGSYIDITSALGVDYWIRLLHDGTDRIGRSVSGYIEEYLIMYVRLGLERRPRTVLKNWYAGAGIKYPVYTYEKAYLSRIGYDGDPVLRPDPDYSLYVKAGYRFSGKYSFSFYYDGYNFRKSPTVRARRSGVQFLVHQPESLQYTLGFMLNYHFRKKTAVSSAR